MPKVSDYLHVDGPAGCSPTRSGGVKVAVQFGLTPDLAEPAPAGPGPVDAVVTSDEVAASRPAPYLVFRCMERTGVRGVAEVLVAGDTPHDLAAGTNAGHVVGVLSGAVGAGALGSRASSASPRCSSDPALVEGR